MALKIAFDVDGTLIYLTGEKEDCPRYDVIQNFLFYEKCGCEMWIWSGGGVDYAERFRLRLGLNAKVVPKGSFMPDIAVDDEIVNLGRVNLKV